LVSRSKTHAGDGKRIVLERLAVGLVDARRAGKGIEQTLDEIGISGQPSSVVGRLAKLAHESGLDGVVASAQEIELIRAAIKENDFLIVTPGIRSATDATQDQRRTMTAAEAIRAGADYIVVGRPIIGAADMAVAAGRFIEEIQTALQARASQA